MCEEAGRSSESETSSPNEVVAGELSELEGSRISCGHRVYRKKFGVCVSVCAVDCVNVPRSAHVKFTAFL